jgi:inosine/xanthosine triphosphatase
MSKKIAIGTKNPAKIKAVEIGFTTIWPNETFEFMGLEVESGVPAQPMSDAESIQGARNRARKAQEELGADYGVGLEGGLQEIAGLWFDCGWCVIVNEASEEGIASSAKIPVPEKMMQHIREGEELGQVLQRFTDIENIKQKEGHFGIMTDNAITRTDGYVHGVILALSRFLHPELF